MSVTVRLTPLCSDRIDGVDSVEVEGTTVGVVLERLTARHPTLAPLVWSGPGAVNPVMVVFLNQRQLSEAIRDTPVADGDEIAIVPAIEGG